MVSRCLEVVTADEVAVAAVAAAAVAAAVVAVDQAVSKAQAFSALSTHPSISKEAP